jgi:hypothetical protein
MNDYLFKTRLWLKIALLNFSVVALAGVILRYKINFSLPVINQKNLLHAHSHFAFTGWVSIVLMALMVNYLVNRKVQTNYKKYHLILSTTCIIAYGMLFSFIAQGYALYSIIFSTLSIFASYFFIFFFWRDLKKVKDEPYITTWFKAALILWAISSVGAFTLAFLMANHINIQKYYFGAIYFFLHFQYNGWFLFVCFGLLFSCLPIKDNKPLKALCKKIFFTMAITVAPAYFLSIIWLELPQILYYLADAAGILQLLVLFYVVKLLVLIKKSGLNTFNRTTKYLWTMVSIAFLLKIILQLLSINPYLNHFAFSFRPIVIGYLHLSFLGIISFFILGFMNQTLIKSQSKISHTGVLIFTIGVLAQEFILLWQGLEVFAFKSLPFADIILFFLAIIIASGLIWITVKMNSKKAIS